MLVKFGDFQIHSAYFLVTKLMQYFKDFKRQNNGSNCDFTLFWKKVQYQSEKKKSQITATDEKPELTDLV